MTVMITSLLVLGCGKKSGGSGPEAKAASALDALNSASTKEEKLAAIGLLKDVSASASEEAGAKAVELLKDGEMEVQIGAMDLIAVMKYNDPAAVTAISGLFQSSSELEIKKHVIQTLKGIGATDQHVKICKEAMAGGDEEMLGYAAYQLSDVGEAAAAAQAELIAALDSKEPYGRMYAAMALGNIGSKAAEAKAKLEALTSDKDSDVAAAAKEALEKIQ